MRQSEVCHALTYTAIMRVQLKRLHHSLLTDREISWTADQRYIGIYHEKKLLKCPIANIISKRSPQRIPSGHDCIERHEATHNALRTAVEDDPQSSPFHAEHHRC